MSFADSKLDNMMDWVSDTLENVNLMAGYSGDEMRANCPFCIDDTKKHLYINKNKPVYVCFKCEESGTWSGLIMEAEGCTFNESIAILAGAANVGEFTTLKNWIMDHVEKVVEKSTEEEIELPDFQDLSLDGDTLHDMVRRYLKKTRKIPDWLLWSGIFKVLPGEMRAYVMVTDSYWQGRSILRQEPKYKNATKKKKGLLGIYDNSLLEVPEGPVWVVEGMFSGLALLKRENAVGVILGKTANEFVRYRLAKIANERGVVIYMDADAVDHGWKLGQQLRELGAENISIAIPEWGDPEDNPDDYQVYDMSWQNDMLYQLSKTRR